MEQNPYEAPKSMPAESRKPQLPLDESLVAFPGWRRIALLFLIVSALTALFLVGLLYVLLPGPI